MLKFIAVPLILVAASSLADTRAQLDRFAEDLASLSGQFTQITLDGNGRVIEEAEGQLFYQSPNQFRWSYTQPFPQELVADGSQLWHYDESLDQVTVRDQPPAAESPLLVLTRPELLDRFYRVEPEDGVDRLTFSPLGEDAEFEQATLYFRDGLPRLLELSDRFGQLTQLELIDLVRNPELDPALFNFIVPPDADVLEGY